MRIIKKIHILVATLLMGVMSCTYDLVLEDNPVTDGSESYISLSINTGITTRVGSSPPPASLDDAITSARMVLYGADDHIVKYAFNFNIRNNASNTGFTQNGIHPEYGDYLYNGNLGGNRFITFARPVKYADYEMLIIINPFRYISEIPMDYLKAPASVMTRSGEDNLDIVNVTNVGQPLSRLLESVYQPNPYFGSGYMPVTEGGIVMTNFKGLVHVPKSSLGNTPDEANKNPIPVTVERTVAKVQVENLNAGSYSLETTDPLAQAINISWQLNTTNKWFYWMRQFAPVINPDGSQGSMETSTDLDRMQLYAIDPNFSGLTDANGGNSGMRTFNFQYAINQALNSDYGASNITFNNGLGGGEYALENTMDVDEQDESVMTTVLIQLSYIPNNSFYGYNNYFVYNNIVITPNEMIGYATTPTSIPPALTGLATAIYNIMHDPDEPIDLSNNYLVSWGLNSGFETADGLKFFHQCKNYYSVKIRHSVSGDPDQPLYARYGVVRNNCYIVKLGEVSGFGSPTVVNPAAMSAEISVQPWGKYSQGANIGEDGEVIGK